VLVTLTLYAGDGAPAVDAGGDAAADADGLIAVTSDGDTHVDVELHAAPGTVLRQVADALCILVGASPGTSLYTGSTRLDPEAPVGGPGLRSGAVLGVGRPGPRAVTRGAVLELHVVSGLQAGSSVPLPRGEHLLGRGSETWLRLSDPLCSRTHAVLRVGTDGVRVADLGSANGSWLGGRAVSGDGEPLAPGALLHLGDTVLRVAVPTMTPATVAPAADGTLAVRRAPRLAGVPAEVTVDWPRPPTVPSPPRLAVLGLLLPVLLGVGLAVLLHTPQFLLLTALSPVLMLGNHLSERSGRRSRGRRERREHAAAEERARDDRDEAVTRIGEQRRRDSPDLCELIRAVEGPGHRLWERRRDDPDFLRLRLGTATMPGGVQLRRETGTEAVPIPDLPVTVALATTGVLGLAGPDPRCGHWPGACSPRSPRCTAHGS